MKWWGWGDPDVVFPAEEKENLWPWSRRTLGIVEEVCVPPVPRESVRLPAARRDPRLVAALAQILPADAILSDDDERLLHAYGKSYPDLLRVRRGEVLRAPDLVCLPGSHDDVERIVRVANELDACVVPFGGGTNVVGAVNPLATENRVILCVDLRRMNRVVSLDPHSLTATIEAGARGPEIERALGERGFTLGHFPDSFEYSTLGGWLATRSAGMQSDAYGRIEDMVVALRLVSPEGTIATRATPASSAGPDLNRFVVGSEGVLGVITEATMRIHRAPRVKDIRGFLFPSFEAGVHAVREVVGAGLAPAILRLSDEGETELAFQLKRPRRGLEALAGKALGRYLRARGYVTPSLLIAGFEGDPGPVARQRRGTSRILGRFGAIPLGTRAGESWSRDKYTLPYLRDFIMDYGCMVDIAETSVLWSGVLPLYRATLAAARERFATDGVKGYVGCHISHTYRTGACLYFTYATPQKPGRELEHYYGYKRLFTETFLREGGTLSHHHGVGREHLPWVREEISPAGIRALRAVKASLDPKGIFNPGKLLCPES